MPITLYIPQWEYFTPEVAKTDLTGHMDLIFVRQGLGHTKGLLVKLQ